MASIHRDPRGKSKFWYAAFTTADRKRHFKSTKTTNKKQAEAIAAQWQNAAYLAAAGKLSPDRVREVLKKGLEEILAATGDTLPSYTARNWVERWLSGKTRAAEMTLSSCRKAGEYLLESLGVKADRDLTLVGSDDIGQYKTFLSKRFKSATVNLYLTKIRECFNVAVKLNILTVNPALAVEKLKPEDNPRRAFEPDEIKRLMAVCDSEWRGMVLVGAYTGARIGDAANIVWSDINLTEGNLTLRVRKTGKTIELPLARPLKEHIESLPVGDTDPRKTPLFPSLAGKKTDLISCEFGRLLLKAKLTEPHREGTEDKQRETRELSYHSLRHFCVTQLKASGSSNAKAQAMVGHASGAVNLRYTDLTAEDLRGDIERMVDVTKA